MKEKRYKNTVLSVMVIITVANILGKILGFVKDVLVSYYYGTNEMTDAFFLALSIPTILLGMFTGSTDGAVIPQYHRVRELYGQKKADKLFSCIINALSMVGIFLTIAILLWPQLFIYLFAPQFSIDQVNYAVIYLRIFAPVGLFHILYCFLCTYNVIYERTNARAILSFSTNLFIIIAMVFIHDKKMYALSIAFLAGNFFAAFLPLIVAFKVGYRHTMSFDFSDPEIQKFCKLFAPIMGSALLNDINLYIDKFLASPIIGGVSSLNYASRLVSIFDSMLVVGLSVVLLPRLSSMRLKGENERFTNVISSVVVFLILALLPIVVLSLCFNKEIVQIIYMRGKFDSDSALMVSKIFLSYGMCIMLFPLQATLSRIFHANENMNAPWVINLIAAIMNIVLSIMLSHIYGIIGIALGTSLSTLIGCIIMIVIIGKKYHWNRILIHYGLLAKTTFIIAVNVLTIMIIKRFFIQPFVSIMVSTVLIFIEYVILCLTLMKKDLLNAIHMLHP